MNFTTDEFGHLLIHLSDSLAEEHPWESPFGDVSPEEMNDRIRITIKEIPARDWESLLLQSHNATDMTVRFIKGWNPLQPLLTTTQWFVCDLPHNAERVNAGDEDRCSNPNCRKIYCKKHKMQYCPDCGTML